MTNKKVVKSKKVETRAMDFQREIPTPFKLMRGKDLLEVELIANEESKKIPISLIEMTGESGIFNKIKYRVILENISLGDVESVRSSLR
jgi:hypothetical protein